MRLVYLSLIVAATGCGEGGDGRGRVEPAQLAAELGEVTCARLVECCTAAELMEQTLGAQDEQECRDVFAGLLGSLLVPVLEDSIAAGRVIYHADRMGACLDAMASLSCAEAAAIQGEMAWGGCPDPFEAQVADGGTCASDFDCVGGECAGASTDFEGNITYGSCARPPAIGESCDDLDCAAGAYCDRTDGPATCQAPRSDGSACTSDDQCASGSCGGDVCGAPTECDGVD